MKTKVIASVLAVGISWLLIWAISGAPDLLLIALVHSVTMFAIRLKAFVCETAAPELRRHYS